MAENEYTELGMDLPRNYFYLGQEHVFSAEAGIIYPIYQCLLFPGDLIEVKNQCVIRQQPTINPSFSRFKAKFYDVVIAIRNLDKDIYRFLSGYEEYTSEEKWEEPLPRWIPSTIEKTRPGTLWDFLENPTSIIPDEDSCQIDYFRQAYGYCWEMLFRNEMRQDSILIKGQPGSWKGEDLLRINWDKDFITTSLPKQQLGDPYAIPLTGIGSAVWNADDIGVKGLTNSDLNFIITNNNAAKGLVAISDLPESTQGILVSGGGRTDTSSPGTSKSIVLNLLNQNQIDFSTAGSILLSNIREMIAYQVMSEINAMSGIRDDEFLQAHWGVRPSNEALQYPEIFGKDEMAIVTSEVLQTSQSTTDSALGDMAGHGLGVGRGNHEKRFYAKEFSIYLKLMYIKCDTLYGGQQAKREYTQKSMYDFPFPELNHISMQPLYEREINCKSTKVIYSDDAGVTLKEGVNITDAENQNAKIKGYQPNFSWYKEKQNRISGLMKMEQYYKENKTDADIEYNYNLYNWTEARFFKLNDEISVNNEFLTFKLDNRNYQIVDDTIERSQFIVWHKNDVDSWRTLSKKSMPSSLGMVGGI